MAYPDAGRSGQRRQGLEMKLHLGKRELVAMFMESPFYFELRVRERLFLLKDHLRRLAGRASQSGLALVHSVQADAAVDGATRPQTDAAGSAKIIVGYFPPSQVAVGT